MIILIRRHIDLIQLLIQENKCKPASFFGEELHVSSKTIYSDIHELEVFIKHFGLELTTVPGSGIRLEGASENKKELLKFIHTAIKKRWIFKRNATHDDRKENICGCAKH